MLLIPATAHSLEESAAITQYYSLAQANRRAAEKEEVAKNQEPSLKPKNAVSEVPAVAPKDTKKIIAEETRSKPEKSNDPSLGQNVDFVF